MATVDPNPPITPLDTTGVTGSPGALSQGTAGVSPPVDTTIFGGGPGEDPIKGLMTGTPSTDGTNSANSTTFVPTSTGLAGTVDSIQGGGGLRLDANPVYRAPAGPVAASNLDTTRTDSPVTGTILVTNKAYVKSTKIGTIQTNSALTFTVGAIATLFGVDPALDGQVTIVTATAPGLFTFSTNTPAADIVSTPVIGGSAIISYVANMSNTPDSYNIGAVPVTNLNVPNAPTIGTATANSNGTVTITWTPPTNPVGALIRRFVIESSRGYNMRVPANVSTWTTDQLAVEAGYPVTFTVRASNVNGNSAASAASNSVTPLNVNFNDYQPGVFTPDGVTSPIYKPSGNMRFATALVQNRQGVTATWTLPALPNLQPYTGGIVRIFNAVTGAQVGVDHAVAGTATTYTQSALVYGTAYTAQVLFTDTATVVHTDDGVSNAVTLVNLVPIAPVSAPTGVDAGGGLHRVNLTWVAPTDIGNSAITGYKVEWSADNFVTVAGTFNTGTTALTGPIQVVAGTFKFRVSGTNAVGTGAASPVSANIVVA
jgi:hypothetical protein